MDNNKSIETPFDMKTSLAKLLKEHKEYLHEMKEIPYQKTVGSLIYAIVATKLDLVFAASVVSWFVSKPGPMHWMAVK